MNSYIEDRVAVIETVYKYAAGLDTRDWALYRSIFTDQITVDFSSYNGQPAERIKADEWVERIKPLFSGLEATQHIMTNPIVKFEENLAVCQIYMQAEHFLDSRDDRMSFTIGGRYINQLIHYAGSWLITSVVLDIFWRRGDPDIMVMATEKGRHID